MKLRLSVYLSFALGLIFLSSLAHAQVTAAEAQLNGTVRDQMGSVVAKASITLRNVDTNRVYATVSNSFGFYILTNVEPGNYELSVESHGFAKHSQTGMVLRVAQVATIDIALKVAVATET